MSEGSCIWFGFPVFAWTSLIFVLHLNGSQYEIHFFDQELCLGSEQLVDSCIETLHEAYIITYNNTQSDGFKAIVATLVVS